MVREPTKAGPSGTYDRNNRRPQIRYSIGTWNQHHKHPACYNCWGKGYRPQTAKRVPAILNQLTRMQERSCSPDVQITRLPFWWQVVWCLLCARPCFCSFHGARNSGAEASSAGETLVMVEPNTEPNFAHAPRLRAFQL